MLSPVSFSVPRDTEPSRLDVYFLFLNTVSADNNAEIYLHLKYIKHCRLVLQCQLVLLWTKATQMQSRCISQLRNDSSSISLESNCWRSANRVLNMSNHRKKPPPMCLCHLVVGLLEQPYYVVLSSPLQ